MTISAQVRRGPGDWYGSPVKVIVQQHASRYVLRIQLYSKIALELRLSHARRLADWIHDVLDAHEQEHPHETPQPDAGEELPNHEELDTHTATQGHERKP